MVGTLTVHGTEYRLLLNRTAEATGLKGVPNPEGTRRTRLNFAGRSVFPGGGWLEALVPDHREQDEWERLFTPVLGLDSCSRLTPASVCDRIHDSMPLPDWDDAQLANRQQVKRSVPMSTKMICASARSWSSFLSVLAACTLSSYLALPLQAANPNSAAGAQSCFDGTSHAGHVLSVLRQRHAKAEQSNSPKGDDTWSANCTNELPEDADHEFDFLLATPPVTPPWSDPSQPSNHHSDFLPEAMRKLVISATRHVDILNLGQPSGAFEIQLRKAIARINRERAYPTSESHRLHIRYYYGVDYFPIVGGEKCDSKALVESLTGDILASDGLNIRVSVACREPGISGIYWNHSKMVVVDGREAIVGGHILKGPEYLNVNPRFDISMRLIGDAAHGAQRFAQALWDKYVCSSWVQPATRLMYSVPATNENYLRAACRNAYTRPAGNSRTASTIPVIAAGTQGSGGDKASDDALFALIESARRTVLLSQQDLVEVRQRGMGVSPGLMARLRDKMAEGVDVYIMLSNNDNGERSWSNATLHETLSRIVDYIEENPGPLSGRDIGAILCERLHLAPIRFSDTEEEWSNGDAITNHAKLVLVDDEAFYIGSQNLYPGGLGDDNRPSLFEFGFIVESPSHARRIRSEYWDPLWSFARNAAISGSDAPSCSWPLSVLLAVGTHTPNGYAQEVAEGISQKLTAHHVRQIAGEPEATDLVGVDVLALVLPNTATRLDAVRNFVNQGGNVLIVGEWGLYANTYAPAARVYANAFGFTMGGISLCNGCSTLLNAVTVKSPQLGVPGVGSVVFVAATDWVSGGVPLLMTSMGLPVFSVKDGGGRIAVSGDGNLWATCGYDNAVFTRGLFWWLGVEQASSRLLTTAAVPVWAPNVKEPIWEGVNPDSPVSPENAESWSIVRY